MATINYSIEALGNSVKVEWSGLAGGDVGQTFDSSGLKIGSVQHWGNFNANTLSVQASNEITAANYLSLYSVTSAQFRTPEADSIPTTFGAVRPSLDGTGGSVNVAIIFVPVA